jgi:hypothetical protein
MALFNAHAEGYSTLASGGYSHAEGYRTSALGNEGSHSEGNATIASGYDSHAEGHSTQANGTASHAEGWETITINSNAHAEGWGCTAVGSQSHAEGEDTQAIGVAAHAEGYATIANGNGSHAEGYTTMAGYYDYATSITYGIYSHAEGYNTKAFGDYSHAGGYDTMAGYSAMTVIGKYNNPNLETSAAFAIGNGTSEQNRSDAFIVNWDGTVSAKKFIEEETPLAITGGDYVSVTEDTSNNKLIIDMNSEMGTMLTELSGVLSAKPSTGRYILGVDGGILSWLEVNK